MDPGTAANRLVKDLLFDFVVKAGGVCFRCGEPMTRQDFSIEHKEAWLDSSDPVGRFFDLENIAFSHLRCNASAACRPTKSCGTISRYDNGCRCPECVEAKSIFRARYYTTELRSAKFARTGN